MGATQLPGERIEKVIRREHWEEYETHVEAIRHKAKLSSFWRARLREAFEAGFKAGRELADRGEEMTTAIYCEECECFHVEGQHGEWIDRKDPRHSEYPDGDQDEFVPRRN